MQPSMVFTAVGNDADGYALKTGIMLGMSQTKFAPVDDMNRAMAITVLYRMAGSPEVTGT